MDKQDINKDNRYDIRYFQENDQENLKRLLMQPELQKWFPLSSEEDVDIFIKNLVNFSKYKCALTAVFDGVPVGYGFIFLLPYKKVAIHATAYLLVDPAFQKRGVGTSLLRNLVHLSLKFEIVEKIQCEIYEGCSLLSILEKLSFKKVFMQNGFVRFSNDETRARVVFERSNRIEV
ncbi:MAG: GNAT family N-acetyltransferase [Chlamydiae bacterium]|nr:GNAT family N-acetyltransferase [Chlamydiota bacterium]